MKLSFNLAHEQYLLVKGGRRPKTVRLLEPAEVEIPELSETEAPMAARWDPDSYPERLDHVRSFGGNLYEPYTQTDWRLREDPKTIQQLVDHYASNGVLQPDEMPSSGKIWHMLEDNREVAHASALKKINSMILIGNETYCRCDVPKIHVTLWNRAMTMGIAKARGYKREKDTSGIDKTELFNLSEFEEAMVSLQSHQGGAYRNLKAVEVFDAEAVRFDKKVEMVGRTVGQAVFDNNERMHEWSTAAVRDFLDIREGYTRWLDDPDDVDVVSLLENAFLLFTTKARYYDAEMATFFSNYDRLQDIMDTMEISMDGIAT